MSLDLRKREVRKESKATIKAIEDKVSQSLRACENLRLLIVELKPSSVGLFLSLEDEVDTAELLLINEKYKIALPRWVDKNLGQGEMQYFHLQSTDQIEEVQAFGKKVKQIIETDLIKPDVLIVPGLAFSRSGNRLGRGKAFYDRYLSDFSGTTVGLCFEEQILDTIPMDEHDKQLDVVVTSKGIFK